MTEVSDCYNYTPFFAFAFFRGKKLLYKFIILVVYLWFVVANENSLLWGTFFKGVSNVRCEDVEHYFGNIIAIETSPIYS